MKFVGLASLVLATLLGASNASAGFIPIDSFDNINPGGIYLTRTAGSGGIINFNATGGLLSVQAGVDIIARFTYTFNSVNFGGFHQVQFSGLSGYQATTTATLRLNGGTNYAGVFNEGAGTLTFSLPNPLTGVTAMRFSFEDGDNAINFTAASLQAVPEPTTLALIGLVGAGGGVAGWRRRRAAKA